MMNRTAKSPGVGYAELLNIVVISSFCSNL